MDENKEANTGNSVHPPPLCTSPVRCFGCKIAVLVMERINKMAAKIIRAPVGDVWGCGCVDEGKGEGVCGWVGVGGDDG